MRLSDLFKIKELEDGTMHISGSRENINLFLRGIKLMFTDASDALAIDYDEEKSYYRIDIAPGANVKDFELEIDV